MKAMLRHVDDHGVLYDAVAFWCPGCADAGGHGLHMLPVNTTEHSPSWTWDGNIDAPTLQPSIMSHGAPFDENGKPVGVCHSYLKAGVLEFLTDCTHSLVGQFVPLPDLPDWVGDG